METPYPGQDCGVVEGGHRCHPVTYLEVTTHSGDGAWAEGSGSGKEEGRRQWRPNARLDSEDGYNIKWDRDLRK